MLTKMTNTKRFFADTNVLVYLISEDASKARTAAEILKAAPFISVQVLNEFVSVARRKHKKSWDDIHDVLDFVKTECPLVALTVETHERAIGLAESSLLDIYDACIVAAAEIAGCGVLYTEDLNHGQRIGGVTVHNPFS